MQQHRFLLKKIFWIFLLLPLMTGCEKDLKGYEKIIGTATINGQNYKESTQWAWNFNGYPFSVALYENRKVFNFLVRLSPEKGNGPKHVIYFYGLESGTQIKLNQPYKLDFYKKLDAESLFWSDVIPYLSENSSEVLAPGADGIAYVAVADNSEEVIPLKGEITFEKIDTGTRDVCFGSYSLTSSGENSEKLVINGKFEATYYVSSLDY